jgi:hypothetical protein
MVEEVEAAEKEKGGQMILAKRKQKVTILHPF